MNDTQINKLVADASAVNEGLVNQAIYKAAKEREDRKVNTMVQVLSVIHQTTQDAVKVLREARAAEKKAKTRLVLVASAEEVFLQTGDVRAYATAIFGADNARRVERFVQDFCLLGE